MSLIIIDSSALLALLQSEAGARAVEDEVEGALMASVNLGEAAQRRYRDGMMREQIVAVVEALGLNVVPVDQELALDAAELRETCRTKGLSQADCVCLALARRRKVAVLTADRKWLEVAKEIGVEVRLIR